jgi:hypothetical protein
MKVRQSRHYALATAAISLAVAACTPPGGVSQAPAPPPERRTVTGVGGPQGNVEISVEQGVIATDLLAPVDEAWTALVEVYQELELELGKIDPNTYTLGNPALVASRRLVGLRLSRLFRCGDTMTGPVADGSRVTVNIETRLEASEGGSRALSMVEASAVPFDGSGANRQCTTTGRLETEIHQALLKKLTS